MLDGRGTGGGYGHRLLGPGRAAVLDHAVVAFERVERRAGESDDLVDEMLGLVLDKKVGDKADSRSGAKVELGGDGEEIGREERDVDVRENLKLRKGTCELRSSAGLGGMGMGMEMEKLAHLSSDELDNASLEVGVGGELTCGDGLEPSIPIGREVGVGGELACGNGLKLSTYWMQHFGRARTC